MKSTGEHPPQWADKLLNYFCRADYVDEILGDLHEAFYWRIETTNVKKARRRFAWEVVRSLRPKNLKSFYHFSLNTMIIRNYIKIALRTFLKRKSTSFINLFGLSLGAAAFALIFLYSYQILSFDDHHLNKDRTFLAYKERITPDGIQETYDTWVPMKERLKSDYPQVKEATWFLTTGSRVIKNEQFIEEDIVYTDESFFKIFSFPVLHGQEGNLFANKRSAVLSAEMALKYFAKENAVGEEMEIFLPLMDTTLIFEVSAILEEFPENITHQPDLVIQFESVPLHDRFATSWNSSFLETYVLLDDPVSATVLESSFPDLVEAIWGPGDRANTNFKLLPFESYYDTFLGDKSTARTLLLIGLGILLIAAINFMNLSTAQASQRTKEIGLRKVFGAFRVQLKVQFLTEAFVSSLFATLVGMALVIAILPSFNNFFDVSLSLSVFPITYIILFCLLLSIALGILSGSYPALYLSSIRSIDALKQKLGFGGITSFRNVLVVAQFSIALFLITSTILVRNQIDYMAERNMGYESDGMVAIAASPSAFENREQGIVRLNNFKNQLKRMSYIEEVTMSRSIPTSWTRSFVFVRPDGWNGDPLRMRRTYVDANFFNTYGMELKYGSYFLADSEGDQRESVILNEAAFKAFGFEPGDQNIIKMRDTPIRVVGVVEDFNYESLQLEVAPTLIFHRTGEHAVHQFITCRMSNTNFSQRLQEIEGLWDQLGSTNDFTYYFLDDRVQEMYEAERRYLGLVSMFSGLAIIVACLGLYGLTLFVIERRRKEISIRKVLGAETNRILQLIFKDFSKWVLIAFVLSIPFVLIFISDWLEGYHYRVGISWVTFALALALVAGLVLLTVGYQSLKAAFANPVQHLNEE